jgi:hypothetical protein
MSGHILCVIVRVKEEKCHKIVTWDGRPADFGNVCKLMVKSVHMCAILKHLEFEGIYLQL